MAQLICIVNISNDDIVRVDFENIRVTNEK